MGVWIETGFPVRIWLPMYVTPFVGVWIETEETLEDKLKKAGHTLRGCVD